MNDELDVGDKALITLIVFVVGGSFVGVWAWGFVSGNPMPIILWFAAAFALAAAGG